MVGLYRPSSGLQQPDGLCCSQQGLPRGHDEASFDEVLATARLCVGTAAFMKAVIRMLERYLPARPEGPQIPGPTIVILLILARK